MPTRDFAYWVILHAFCPLLVIFKINFFRNTIRVANRTSGLIWIQNVCKSYQQMIKVAASRQIVNSLFLHYVIHTIRAINVLQFYVVYFHSILASVIVICEINLHKCWFSLVLFAWVGNHIDRAIGSAKEILSRSFGTYAASNISAKNISFQFFV